MFMKKNKFFREIVRNRYFDLAILALAIGLYSLLTFSHIDGSSIWFDEAFGAYLAKFNFIEIARYTAADVHPPVYYWLLKIWTMFFGDSELAIRSMSVFFGGTAIAAGYLLVKKLFTRQAAWIAGLLMAVSPMFIRYGEEARMYTFIATIALLATYVLVDAVKTNSKRRWTQYAALVALGMWTHYFTAVVWLSHWVWRFIMIRDKNDSFKKTIKKMFSKEWFRAHALAIAFFAPWLPFMALQLTTVQVGGFWIGPIGINSYTNYLTNTFYYQEYQQVISWSSVLLMVVIVGTASMAVKVYRKMNKEEKTNYLLIGSMAFAMPVILMAISLPPLTSAYVERYLLTGSVAMAIFIAITIYYGFKDKKLRWTLLATVVVVAAMITGIQNVYFYGNYNKNSQVKVMAREVVAEVANRSTAGEPIIASSPWSYYESVFYTTPEHQVYFVDSDTSYEFGSLDMLKYNDTNKIKDIDAFTKANPVFWYIGYADGKDLEAPYSNICKIESFDVTDNINYKNSYKAVEYERC